MVVKLARFDLAMAWIDFSLLKTYISTPHTPGFVKNWRFYQDLEARLGGGSRVAKNRKIVIFNVLRRARCRNICFWVREIDSRHFQNHPTKFWHHFSLIVGDMSVGKCQTKNERKWFKTCSNGYENGGNRFLVPKLLYLRFWKNRYRLMPKSTK